MEKDMTTEDIYRERREAVAERITANPHRFDMNHWSDSDACETTYCIGGWAAVVANDRGEANYIGGPDVYVFGQRRGVGTWATEWLGLNYGLLSHMSDLFESSAPHQTPEDAALALKEAPYCIRSWVK